MTLETHSWTLFQKLQFIEFVILVVVGGGEHRIPVGLLPRFKKKTDKIYFENVFWLLNMTKYANGLTHSGN